MSPMDRKRRKSLWRNALRRLQIFANFAQVGVTGEMFRGSGFVRGEVLRETITTPKLENSHEDAENRRSLRT
jgi:hypothetical protein